MRKQPCCCKLAEMQLEQGDAVEGEGGKHGEQGG
jgi:hypothetical protein